MSQGWWHDASTEQRLAQIDGGIECGMTSWQIAKASGLDMDRHPAATLATFAGRHGRHFPRDYVASSQKHIAARGALQRTRAAFLRGERVDFFAGKTGVDDEFRLDDVGA